LTALARLCRRDANDNYIRGAAYSSLATGGTGVLAVLADDDKFAATEAGRNVLGQLAELTGAQSQPEELSRFETILAKAGGANPALASTLVRGFMSGRQRAGQSTEASSRVAEILEQLLRNAHALAQDDKQPLANRQDAVRVLALGEFAPVADMFAVLLEGRQPQELQLAAVETLGRFDDAEVARPLLEAWPGMSPRVRGAAADALFSRPKWLMAVFDAIEQEEVAATEFDPARIKLLQEHPNAEIRGRAGQLLSKLSVGSRQEVLNAYQPVLSLAGDAVRGKAAFQKTCAACHRLEDVGYEIGPNLATLKNRGAEAILLNVLDPNREVNPQYVNYLLATQDARTLSGMIVSETAASITLRRAENATDTVLRSEIDQLRSTGQSIMPEGLEKQIDQQTMADLIAYLLSIK
jgi:putative heme-binding domain-containing protein